MRHTVIPIFIPHKGCPFDCIYCNQKAISGEMSEMTVERMREIIEEHLATISENTYVEIGFYGGSFTGIDKDQQILFLQAANEYFAPGRVRSIRLSTRPDYITSEILEYLKAYNVKTIELGAQSLDRMVLARSCRGHSIEDVENASVLIKEFGFELGIQTMIGLPEDDAGKALDTAKRVVRMKPNVVRIYPTLVIKETFLEKMYRSGEYNPLTLENAVGLCAQLLDLYEMNGIQVIRVGLQPTDAINENMDVVAGPFHPAFRQLVESKRMMNRMTEELQTANLENSYGIEIYASPSEISNVIGQKRSNIEALKSRYGFEIVKVRSDEMLKHKQIRLKIMGKT